MTTRTMMGGVIGALVMSGATGCTVEIRPVVVTQSVVTPEPAGAAAPSGGVTRTTPTQTREPVVRLKLGGTATYADGLRVTVLAANDRAPEGLVAKPPPGLRYLAISVRIDNAAAIPLQQSGDFRFYLQDSSGIRRGRVAFASALAGALGSGIVGAGSAVTGFVMLAAPINDQHLDVISDDLDRGQAAWELYDGPTISAPPVPSGAVSKEFPGWRVTLLRWEEQPQLNGVRTLIDPPGPGMRLITVVVRVDNAKPQSEFLDADYFEVQDDAGVRRRSGSAGLLVVDALRPDTLGRGRLVPGGYIVGTIVFQVPKEDARLQLAYTGRNLEFTTWDLR